MLASHAHRFIFLKTRKTAGTSLEIALSAHLGEADVICPISPADEIIRAALFPNALPRNYSTDPAAEAAYRAAIRQDRLDDHGNCLEPSPQADRIFFNHMPAGPARRALGEAFWDRAFKFSMERHPYEKVVSLAYFRMPGAAGGDFARLLDEEVERGAYRNFDIYSIDGSTAVDFIIRYEALEAGIRHVERVTGCADILARMPFTKNTQRRDRRSAREILNRAQKLIVRERCSEEFALFNYDY